MTNIDYFIKYRKYKQKYIIQKNILSGGCFLVNDKFLALEQDKKKENIDQYTPKNKSEFITKKFDFEDDYEDAYEDAYMHFYKNLTKYIYRKYNFEGSELIHPINNWKISLYGCSEDTKNRHEFNHDQFNQLQVPDHKLIIDIKSTIAELEVMGMSPGEKIMPAIKPNGIWTSELLIDKKLLTDEELLSMDYPTWIKNKMEWTEKTKPGNCHGFLIIRLNPEHTLTLITESDFKSFTDEYAFKEFQSKTKFINWHKVSKKYGAINLPHGAFSQAWFKDWEVVSSVIWDIRAVLDHRYITLSELENDFTKYMYDCPELFD